MNRKAILDTAVCYWSDDDNSFVVKSPVSGLVASADTEEAALESFCDKVALALEALAEGRVAEGQAIESPLEDADFGFRTSTVVMEELANLAEEMELSLSQVVHYLLLEHKAHAGCESSTSEPDVDETVT